MNKAEKIRIGVLGYGKLGRFIVKQILSSAEEDNIELSFIWNRSKIVEPFENQNNKPLILESFDDISKLSKPVHLVIEVCHPNIVHQDGETILKSSNLLIGSPVALMDDNLREKLLNISKQNGKRIFVATGALWGSSDIRRLSKLSLLQSASIQMRFSPKALRLVNLQDSDVKIEKTKNDEILYSGTVRQLSKIAPNNVNTMACLALSGLGPDNTHGILISDSKLTGFHKITVTVKCKPQEGFENVFQNTNERLSPTSQESNVTSQQTFFSFWYSVLETCKKLENERNSKNKTSEIEII